MSHLFSEEEEKEMSLFTAHNINIQGWLSIRSVRSEMSVAQWLMIEPSAMMFLSPIHFIHRTIGGVIFDMLHVLNRIHILWTCTCISLLYFSFVQFEEQEVWQSYGMHSLS